MSRGTLACIDLAALSYNLDRVHDFVPNKSIIAMIKSNGYGHGLLRVAKALHNADMFGVASIEEAFTLRQAGIDKPITVMSGFYDAADLPLLIQHDLEAVIHHPSQLGFLEKTPLNSPLKVWLKIDTGMRRLGFLPNELDEAVARLQNCQWVQKPIRLMTHLADADNPDTQFTDKQVANFQQLVASLQGEKSILNSAGVIAHSHLAADWVRPGIMLYGASPFSDKSGLDFGLQPVMTLKSKLMAIKECQQGDVIGYNCTYTCPQKMKIGIVAIGYGDGYPRHASSGTPTLIRQIECPLVGRVSMDMIAVDLSDCPDALVSDEVVLWGQGLPVERIAKAADTIAYELLCGVSSRVEFVYS